MVALLPYRSCESAESCWTDEALSVRHVLVTYYFKKSQRHPLNAVCAKDFADWADISAGVDIGSRERHTEVNEVL